MSSEYQGVGTLLRRGPDRQGVNEDTVLGDSKNRTEVRV